jgi:hypothetical protein
VKHDQAAAGPPGARTGVTPPPEAKKPRESQGFYEERLKGLEPSTFLHGNANELTGNPFSKEEVECRARTALAATRSCRA